MPLPVAHALVGSSVAVLFWPERSWSGFRKAALAGAVLGVCPDFDYLINWIGTFGRGWHHGFTHSVLFAVVAGAAVGRLLGLKSWSGAAACCLALLSHTALDFLVTESRGVALAWPITDQRFKLGNEALNYYHLGNVSPAKPWPGLVRLCLWEFLLFGVPFIAALRLGYLRSQGSEVARPR